VGPAPNSSVCSIRSGRRHPDRLKLDRLSRSLRDVLSIMERLGEAKVGFRSLTEAIDTTTAAGE
jgi:hypothetical protein